MTRFNYLTRADLITLALRLECHCSGDFICTKHLSLKELASLDEQHDRLITALNGLRERTTCSSSNAK